MEEINIQNYFNLHSEEQEYDILSPIDEYCSGPSSFQLFDSNNLSVKEIPSLQKKYDSTRSHTVLDDDVQSNISFEREKKDQKDFAHHFSKNCSAKDDFSEFFETNQRQFECHQRQFEGQEFDRFLAESQHQMESPNECKKINFPEEMFIKSTCSKNSEEKQTKLTIVSKLSTKIKKNENSLETKTSSTKRKTYPVKNLLKIIGNSIISKIKSNSFLNKKILEQSSKMYGINPVTFTEWVDKENYIKTLGNFRSFRDLFNDALLEEKDKNFILVLRQLTLWFLENEIYNYFIFQNKKITVDVTLYLKKIPKILQGIKNPASFYSLR